MARIRLKYWLLFFVTTTTVMWLLASPRGRISRLGSKNLELGMGADDATQIIGVRPGWYDGVITISGLPPDQTKEGVEQLIWANSNGVIVADLNAGIQDVRFYSKQEVRIGIDHFCFVYDRSIQRFYDCESILITWALLFISISIPVAPILLIANIRRVPLADVIAFSLSVILITYVTYCYLTGNWWHHHHSSRFLEFAAILSGCNFVALSMLLVYRLKQNQGAKNSKM